jgi:hypothetical protein
LLLFVQNIVIEVIAAVLRHKPTIAFVPLPAALAAKELAKLN